MKSVFKKVGGTVAVAASLLVIAPLPAGADEGTDLLLKAVRELVFEIDSETVLVATPGQPVARMTARMTFDAARTRIKKMHDETKRLVKGTVVLTGFADRAKSGDVAVTFQDLKGEVIGSLVLARRGKGIAVEVFPPTASIPLQELPIRRVIPRPKMWVVPLGM
jgi:hypothetical protein